MRACWPMKSRMCLSVVLFNRGQKDGEVEVAIVLAVPPVLFQIIGKPLQAVTQADLDLIGPPARVQSVRAVDVRLPVSGKAGLGL